MIAQIEFDQPWLMSAQEVLRIMNVNRAAFIHAKDERGTAWPGIAGQAAAQTIVNMVNAFVEVQLVHRVPIIF